MSEGFAVHAKRATYSVNLELEDSLLHSEVNKCKSTAYLPNPVERNNLDKLIWRKDFSLNCHFQFGEFQFHILFYACVLDDMQQFRCFENLQVSRSGLSKMAADGSYELEKVNTIVFLVPVNIMERHTSMHEFEEKEDVFIPKGSRDIYVHTCEFAV